MTSARHTIRTLYVIAGKHVTTCAPKVLMPSKIRSRISFGLNQSVQRGFNVMENTHEFSPSPSACYRLSWSWTRDLSGYHKIEEACLSPITAYAKSCRLHIVKAIPSTYIAVDHIFSRFDLIQSNESEINLKNDFAIATCMKNDYLSKFFKISLIIVKSIILMKICEKNG